MTSDARSERENFLPSFSRETDVAIPDTSEGKSEAVSLTFIPIPTMHVSINPLSPSTETSVRMPHIFLRFMSRSFTHLILVSSPYAFLMASDTATAVQLVRSDIFS